jgi:hypothetical protein
MQTFLIEVDSRKAALEKQCPKHCSPVFIGYSASLATEVFSVPRFVLA